MTLTNGQRRALVERALRWIETIERLNDFERFTEPATVQDNVHLLMLALKHLATCMTALKGNAGSARLDCLTDRFAEAWEPVSRIRDMLEHEEEYILGRGLRPKEVHPQWGDIGYASSYIAYGEGVISVSVVGGSYQVIEPIRAARSLKSELGKVI